jgi:formate dehydrogenase maturation protein FdhE
MYGSRMKCSNCGKEEIITPNSNQSVDEYMNIKNCNNCGSFGKWEIVPHKIE